MKTYKLSSYKNDHYSYNLIKASLLQKLIRRGMAEEAAYIAKIYLDENQSKGLKRRLQIIAAEDIGFGWIRSINYLEEEKDLILATYNLAKSKKNREADRFLLYTVYNSKKESSCAQKNYEVGVFKKVLRMTSLWKENKSKENFKKMKDMFDLIIDKSKHKEVVSQLLENYINLTKGKIHGARCQLALAVLITCRKFEEEVFVPFKSYSIKEFDEIFDFAIDMHTPIGKELGRDFNHWVENCVLVNNELIYDNLFEKGNVLKYPLNEESNKFKK